MQDYENLPRAMKTREIFLDVRRVYMVAKVKMFAYKPEDFKGSENYFNAKMLGILETLEIYSDKELTEFLFKKEFRKKR